MEEGVGGKGERVREKGRRARRYAMESGQALAWQRVKEGCGM